MKLQYLGTAAAEAVPAPFCECEVCEHARERGGRNIRTRSQALIDDRLLIDFPGDTYLHTLREKFKLCDIDACIITHPHSDHLYPQELFCRTACAAHMKTEKPFRMYGTKPVLSALRNGTGTTGELEAEGRLILTEIRPFEPFRIMGYTITALKADHSTPEPVVYLIENDDGCAMLYCHDTGLLPEETMAYLRRISTQISLASYDCTNGLLEWDNRGHMGVTGAVQTRESLREMNRITDKTLHVLNHFSHNGLAGYDELSPIAEQKGFIVSYDGMTVYF